MPYETFKTLLTRHVDAHGIPDVVSLQGEGDPTLHHDFFKMAEFAKQLGSRRYTITNGTHKHPDRFVDLFPQVGGKLHLELQRSPPWPCVSGTSSLASSLLRLAPSICRWIKSMHADD